MGDPLSNSPAIRRAGRKPPVIEKEGPSSAEAGLSYDVKKKTVLYLPKRRVCTKSNVDVVRLCV